mgnify:FL=1
MRLVKILAVGDVHGFRHLNILLASLKTLINMKPDLIIFAGDMIDGGNIRELRTIMEGIESKFSNVPVISVFGNEEYHEVESELIREYPHITWLNDSITIIYVDEVKVGIVGSRGALEKLTHWQRKNKPVLEKVYRERPRIIENLIREVKKEADITIYLSHYAPTFITVRGEPERILPYMGSRDIEGVLRRTKPDVAIHAHAHNARILEAVLDGVRIYNVSLPARKGVTMINISPKNLSAFMSN